MRRVCAGCQREWNDGDGKNSATARVDGQFFLACGGECLCALLHLAEKCNPFSHEGTPLDVDFAS